MSKKSEVKTVVIWDDCQANIQFFTIEKDLAHLDRKYVNDVKCSMRDSDKISKLVYDADGKQVVAMTKVFPVQDVMDGAKVITIGFLP